MYGVNWEDRYKLAKAYYEHHHNLDVPYTFKTNDGYSEAENGYNLGRWIRYQRTIYDELPVAEKNKLKDIGFYCSVHDKNWDNNYKLLLKYYKKNKNISISYSYVTKDGVALGKWLYSQRSRFDELSDDKKSRLLKLGLVSSLRDTSWDSHYELAKNFYLKNGHLRIPQSFVTSDGLTWDENGFHLGRWIFIMRERFEHLSDKRKNKLNEIGFSLNAQDEVWNQRFELAQIFYERNCNLKIPQSFKTFNGYDYHPDGIRLGAWIYTQRSKFPNISLQRQQKLFGNGMILDVRKNEDEVKNLAVQNDVNLLFNREILDVISFQEFQAKINFLNKYKLLLCKNYELNDIFYMSSCDLERIYGINLYDLIMNYSDGIDSVMKLVKSGK